MTDYEFSRKPHRMTSPPANEGKRLVGYDGVKCRLETDPVKIAVLCREATWGSVYDFEPTPEVIASTLKEIEGGKVLGAAFEVPALAFVMRGSRSCMDQLLRLRESAGASHTTRDNDFRHFNIIIPNNIQALSPQHSHNEEDWELFDRVNEHIRSARSLYGDLVDAGVPPQDARYIALPLGYQGDWVQVMNMRALIKECEQRLCNGLTQHESNYMVRLQRDLVVERWPHMDKLLRSSCEKRGQCASRTMLFPPCGAFSLEGSIFDWAGRLTAMEGSEAAYKSDKHLYHPEQNDAMRFAEWDRERVRYESKGYVVRFSLPPHEQELVVGQELLKEDGTL